MLRSEMTQVDFFVPMGDVGVPVGINGKYLSWEGGDEEYAPPLRGVETFRVGPIAIEYVRMPGGIGLVLIDATDNDGLLHPEDAYNNHEDEEAIDAATRLVLRFLDALKLAGLRHDEGPTLSTSCGCWAWSWGTPSSSTWGRTS
jgi:hypothetical protein